MVATKLVQKDDFRLSDYIPERKITRMTSFAFKEAEIAKLPLLEDKPVDLYDSSLERGEWKLVLRLQKTCKTFHIRNRTGMRGKLGVWMPKPSTNHYPKGFISLAQARHKFEERVEELESLTAEAEQKQKWTIERYLDEQYIRDRAKKPTMDRKIHPITEKTIKEIKQGFGPWLSKRLIDAHEGWPEEFKDYWGTKDYVVPRTQERKTGLTSETQRKYYSMLNAMFHICVKCGYLRNNPIDNQTYRFKRNDQQDITTYEDDYDYHEITDFIFDHCKGSQAGKLLIATIILTGARSSEIFRNKSRNFDSRKRRVFIPAAISKNSGQRHVPIRVDRYWIELETYLKYKWWQNDGDFMFPSSKSATGHSAEGVYNHIWKQIKRAYKITDGVLYDNRHTFATKTARESSVEVTAGLLGDSIPTTYRYYYKNSEDHDAEVVEAIHNKRRTDVPDESTVESDPAAPAPTYTNNKHSDAVVSIGRLPCEVADFFEVFISGKKMPGEKQLYKNDWLSFVEKVERKVRQGRMGEEAEEWLDDVT